MKPTFYFALLALSLSGCAGGSVKSDRDPSTDFSKYNRIAVSISSRSSVPLAGERASVMLASQLVKKGYDVLDIVQLNAIIDGKGLLQDGLTESNRTALKRAGVFAIVLGSVGQYDCYSSIERDAFFLECYVSLSCKMVDLDTGQAVWTAKGSGSRSGYDIDEKRLLQRVVGQIAKEIPSAE